MVEEPIEIERDQVRSEVLEAVLSRLLEALADEAFFPGSEKESAYAAARLALKTK